MAQFVDPFLRYSCVPGLHGTNPAGSSVLLDWVESPNSHIFTINVPGYRKDEIKLQFKEGKVLVIKADCKEENRRKFKYVFWRVAERGRNWRGDFMRQIELTEDVKVGQIKASLENGVLTVVVPKGSSPKPPKIKNIHINNKV